MTDITTLPMHGSIDGGHQKKASLRVSVHPTGPASSVDEVELSLKVVYYLGKIAKQFLQW